MNSLSSSNRDPGDGGLGARVRKGILVLKVRRVRKNARLLRREGGVILVRDRRYPIRLMASRDPRLSSVHHLLKRACRRVRVGLVVEGPRVLEVPIPIVCLIGSTKTVTISLAAKSLPI